MTSGAGRLLLSVKEASELLGVGRGLVYEMVAQDQLPHVRLGRLIKLPRRGLEDWVERQSTVAGDGDVVIELAQRANVKGGQ